MVQRNVESNIQTIRNTRWWKYFIRPVQKEFGKPDSAVEQLFGSVRNTTDDSF